MIQVWKLRTVYIFHIKPDSPWKHISAEIELIRRSHKAEHYSSKHEYEEGTNSPPQNHGNEEAWSRHANFKKSYACQTNRDCCLISALAEFTSMRDIRSQPSIP